MARVWERCLSHAQQSILLALSDHAGDDGSHVYPSLAHIAWKTGYSARQVKRVIADLRRMGVLEVVAPARRGRPVEYRVHIEAVPEKSPLRKDDMKALQDRGDAVTWATVEVASAADTGDISGPIETLLKPEEPTLLPVTSTGTGDAPPVESKVLSPPREASTYSPPTIQIPATVRPAHSSSNCTMRDSGSTRNGTAAKARRSNTF